MKKTLVLSGLLAASTSMMAMDLQYFLGAGVERGDLTGKVTAVGTNNTTGASASSSVSFSDDASNLKLKAGVILDKTHRLSLSHINYGVEDGGDFRIVLANYDYLIPMNEKFRFLVGVHAGHANYEESDDFKMSGLAYGAQIGAIYDITKNVEFELGAGYTLYNVEKTMSMTSGNLDLDIKAELEDSTSLSAAINFKF